MTDPIADMLSRIRNAAAGGHEQLSLPHSKAKEAVAKVLAGKGYLAKAEVDKSAERPQLKLTLAAGGLNPAMTSIKRLSSPGRRLYVKAAKLPTVKFGRGLVVVSTSQGLMTGEEAKAKHLGGELICEVY